MVQSASFLDYLFPPQDLTVFSHSTQNDIVDTKNVAQFGGIFFGTLLLSAAVASIFFGGMGVMAIAVCSLLGSVILIGGVAGNIGAVALPLIGSLGCCCVAISA